MPLLVVPAIQRTGERTPSVPFSGKNDDQGRRLAHGTLLDQYRHGRDLERHHREWRQHEVHLLGPTEVRRTEKGSSRSARALLFSPAADARRLAIAGRGRYGGTPGQS